jgi:hypothetical protein
MDVELIEAVRPFTKVEFREEILPLGDLRVFSIAEFASGYQRPLSESFLNSITPTDETKEDRFDASEARAIFVSERKDGSMWVLDGQHTRELLMRHKIDRWPCRVFMGLTPTQEASRFLEYQRNSRRLGSIERWNASVVAKEPESIAVEKVLEAHNLRISSQSIRAKEGMIPLTIGSVFAKIHEMGGTDLLEATLTAAEKAWGKEKSTYNTRVLSGLAYLLSHASLEIAKPRLTAVLKNTMPQQLIEQIGSTGSGGAGPRGAAVLLERYRLGVTGTEHTAIRKGSAEAPVLLSAAEIDEINASATA